MRLQDFLFNPWWIVSLVVFWTGRQETPWYKTATIVICGLMLGTTAIAFQVWSLHYTAPFIVASKNSSSVILHGSAPENSGGPAGLPLAVLRSHLADLVIDTSFGLN